jgi:adenosine deaminase
VAAGIPVSINSDDPPMFSTTLNDEYAVAAELLGLDEEGLAELAKDAVRQSFLDEPARLGLVAEIDAYATGHQRSD